MQVAAVATCCSRPQSTLPRSARAGRTGARLGIIVHHDDAARELAYDRASHIGKLARGLDEGPKRGWTIVSMKYDWKTVFPDSR